MSEVPAGSTSPPSARLLRRLETLLLGEGRRPAPWMWAGPAISAAGSAVVIWLATQGLQWWVRGLTALLAAVVMGTMTAGYLAHEESEDERGEAGSG